LDIRNFFFRLSIIYSSFFGIGFISKFSDVIASLSAIVLCFIPDIQKVAFWLAFGSSTIFLILSKFAKNTKRDYNVVITKVSGMCLGISSFFFQYSVIWLLIGFMIFNLFIILKPFYIKKINLKNSIILFFDIFYGLLTSVVLHILYIGYKILPLAIMFFENN
jgi:phosphatidylglycerophosphatase A